jgi:hypothetical protein
MIPLRLTVRGDELGLDDIVFSSLCQLFSKITLQAAAD